MGNDILLVMFIFSLCVYSSVFTYLALALLWVRQVRLSMVSANGVTQVARPNLRTTYRKMADVGVQVDSQDSDNFSLSPHNDNSDSDFITSSSFITNSTVAEINTSAEIMEPSRTPPHLLLSLQSSNSSADSGNSEEQHERRRPTSNSDLDMDAICVQQCESEFATEDDVTAQLTKPPTPDKMEIDGFVIEEKPESNCALDCLSFTMHCCECTIL